MTEFRSWRLELEGPGSQDKRGVLDPPGYDPQAARDSMALTSKSKKNDHSAIQRKQQALMARATAPLKQVGFMCFMMWMMGNSIQIFSIIMTVSGLTSPLIAISKCGEAFPRDEEGKLDIMIPRLVYCLIHAGQLLFGLYKLQGMGLLPTNASDWVSTFTTPQNEAFAPGAEI